VKVWVAVTDKNWYEHLTHLGPDEVKFLAAQRISPLQGIAAGGTFPVQTPFPRQFHRRWRFLCPLFRSACRHWLGTPSN
jgi:hypothetical protein